MCIYISFVVLVDCHIRLFIVKVLADGNAVCAVFNGNVDIVGAFLDLTHTSIHQGTRCFGSIQLHSAVWHHLGFHEAFEG